MGAAQSMSVVCVHQASSSRAQTPVQPQVGQVIETQKCSVLSHRVAGEDSFFQRGFNVRCKSHDSMGWGGLLKLQRFPEENARRRFQ